jgi:tRNA/rRNA methyltransferase
MRPFYAYMLRCADESYYVGHTDDLEQRLAEHVAGLPSGSYTASRRPVSLVWSQEFPTREEALAAELRVKKWSRAKKEALVRDDMGALAAAARKQDWQAYRQRHARA